MKILIAPYSTKLPNGKTNPKNYPYWQQLVDLLRSDGHEIHQIGRKDEKILWGVNFHPDKSFSELRKLLLECDTFISVDSFFPHFAHVHNCHGFVLFGPSDPNIFGYEENVNIYKHTRYFRPDQFGLWTECEFDEDAWEMFETFNTSERQRN